MKNILLLIFFCCLGFVCREAFSNEGGGCDIDGTQYSELKGPERNVFLASLKKSLDGVRGIKATFVQERHMEFFMDDLKAEGVCFFEAPDKLRWEISEPFVSILIYNGRDVAKFDMKDSVLRKLSLGNFDVLREVLSQITDWMKGDFSRADGVYNLRVFRGAKNNLLLLEPRSEAYKKAIRTIELTADRETNHITMVVIREPGRDYIRIRFVDEKINQECPVGTFNTDLPILFNK